MLRLWGGRRSSRRGRGRRGGVVATSRTVRVRRGEVATQQPALLHKHLLPCHVRLLDGTDLYIQLPVTDQSSQPKLICKLVHVGCRNVYLTSCYPDYL